mgnify:FL=1
MIHFNLTSHIVLNKVAENLYQPKTAVERSELTRFEKIRTDIFPKTEDAVNNIADAIEREIKTKAQENKPCLLALGTGQSLTPIYEELVRRHQCEGLSFGNVLVFNVYDYFPQKSGSAITSLRQLRDRLLDHVDIRPEHIFSPDGSVAQENIQDQCALYEQQIRHYGGLDIALLGIGRSGNIAANEPGSVITSRSRLILIDSVSREEMTMSFGGQEPVPPCSITMGISTILSARHIYLTAWGDDKADIIQKTVEGPITEDIPASFLQTHNDAHVVVDLAAAAKLTRIVHPWLVSSCKWDDKLTCAAVVWLCEKTQKPILKLTNKDYNSNGLSELLALYGSAYNCNIRIFNHLQHTITGWPGGKPNDDDTYRPERAKPYPKRVIVFSPHPDDDVISMGGTLHRLVEQGHDVHIAYETSGDIAVNDEEVTRFMHFLNGFNQLFMNAGDQVIVNMYHDIKQFLASKKEGDIDTQDVRTIKGLIRRGEARTASTYNGVHSDHVHFLDLPFYESGRVEKYPMTERDVNIVRSLLQDIKPHQIFVAGDLADPHGTHRKCTDAVLAAIDLEQQAGAEWLNDCRIWMYRGAWAEWDVKDIEMCVPMSPEQLRHKRNAILKHASQADFAPFLGNDERLFWQRAEDRNRATAKKYDNLGLACYEAMEAFVEYKRS